MKRKIVPSRENAYEREYRKEYRHRKGISKRYKEDIKKDKNKSQIISKEKKKEYNKNYRLKHKKEIAIYNKKYNKEHKNSIKLYHKEYNKTYNMVEYRKKYYRDNKKIWIEYKINNRDKIRLNSRNYKFNKKNAGILLVETIQLIYENNIKKYGTLTCYLCLESIKFGQDSLDQI